MKTPSSLLLLPLLLAAPAVRAEIKPGQRCDVEFLERVAKTYNNGNIADERITDEPRAIPGGETVARKALKAGDPKVCDAATWAPVISPTDKTWLHGDAKAHWNSNGAKGNAALVLVVSDFYASVDAFAAEALAAADAAVEAGAALGLAAAADYTDQQKAWLAANGGAPTVARAGKSVRVLAKADRVNGTVTPQSVGSALRKLTDDKGQGRAGGSEVLRFRVAVLSLAAALRGHARASGNVRARLGGDVGRLRDFVSAPAKEIPEVKADRASALDDVKYGVALEALTGKGPVASVEDATARPDAALDHVDVALRNLISLRAAQLEGLVAGAKEKLDGKTITQIEVAARASGLAGERAKDNPLAQDVLRRMTETPEYQRLDAMYENKKDHPGWKDSEEGKGVIAARERLQAAALSAKIEDQGGVKKVVYTQGGKKYTLDGFVPDAVANDAATRNDVAGMIARMIVGDEKGDPKFSALVASIKGDVPDPAIAPGEASVARTVPPALKSVKDGAAGCDKPADLINNDHETYASRQRAKAAEVTAENKRRRDAIKAQQGAQLAAAQQVCDQEMAAAQSITKKSDFEADDSLRSRKAAAAAKAKADCDARRAAINETARAALAARDEAEKTTNAAAVIRAADAEVNASFRIAIDASVDALRREYADPKNSRHASLIRGAELRGTSTELVGFVEYWFNRQWPAGEGRKGAIDKCAADMGLGPTIAGKSNPDYANPENPSKVADKCGIHDGLVAYVKAQKNTIH